MKLLSTETTLQIIVNAVHKHLIPKTFLLTFSLILICLIFEKKHRNLMEYNIYLDYLKFFSQ